MNLSLYLMTDQRFEQVFFVMNYSIRGARGICFEITEDVVRDPKSALDKWIRAYYAKGR